MARSSSATKFSRNGSALRHSSSVSPKRSASISLHTLCASSSQRYTPSGLCSKIGRNCSVSSLMIPSRSLSMNSPFTWLVDSKPGFLHDDELAHSVHMFGLSSSGRQVASPWVLLLLVPGFDVDLSDDLAVTHFKGGGGEDSGSVGVLALFVERDTLFAQDLALDAVGHRPSADVAQVLGDFLPALDLARGAGRRALVHDLHLGIVCIEAQQQIGVELLDGLAHHVEVEAVLLLVHRVPP